MQTTKELWNLDQDDCPARTHGHDVTCGGCGKAFQAPILATVSTGGRTQTYYACPRCMTKVSSFKVPEKEEKKQVLAAEDNRLTAGQDSKVNCAHFFGYLSKHQKSLPFPDACLTCKKMVECVLSH